MKITIDTQKDSKEDIQKAINFLQKFTTNTNQNFDLPQTNEDEDEGGIFGAFDDSSDDDDPKIEIVNF